jgi:hypothetical protein
MMHAHEYEFWLMQDLEWLAQCNAILRLPGDSPGADREVKRAEELELIVFRSIREIEVLT